jgi:hypothetical protein
MKATIEEGLIGSEAARHLGISPEFFYRLEEEGFLDDTVSDTSPVYSSRYTGRSASGMSRQTRSCLIEVSIIFR